MTKSLTYVELALPVCTLDYGVAPCSARLVADVDPVAAVFDGVAAYLKRGAGLTGAADGKTFTFSCWVRAAAGAGGVLVGGVTTLNGSVLRVYVALQAGAFRIFARNAAGTNILDVASGTLPPDRWVNLLASFDLSTAGRRFIYVSDVADIAVTTFTNDTIDLTLADWGIGATPDGGTKLTGAVADLWFAPGVYLDLSVEANRRKFIDGDGNPVDLGATGNTPTGSAPLLFLFGDIAAWHTNKATGGGFTKTGTLTAGTFGTGTRKCFNSIRTCQSRASFDPEDVTLRFAKPTDYLPREIDAIPSIMGDVSFTPATISLGENLGQRATLSVTFRDHPDSDTWPGLDKYLSERDYDPFGQGTFFGKFRARHPYLQGLDIAWITGTLGQALEDMEARHFVVESFDGPTPDGKYTLVAKDILKLADGDRSQAPAMNTGYLSAGLSASGTSATLIPTGIGDAEYPAAGTCVLGGNEVCTFTRSGDTLTFSGRGGSTSHAAQDRVQVALIYSGEDPADIIYDLMVNYAGIPAGAIPLTDWQAETGTFLGRLYSATICEPTSVGALISELIQQACLSIWWDDIPELVRLQVLRGIVTDAARFTPENTLQGSLTIKEQPDKRISQVWVYFGQIDPTKALSATDNYRSMAVAVDEDAEADYGVPVIKKIYSRWIPQLGRTVADRLGEIQLGRYRDPPRRLTFDLQRYAGTDAMAGVGYRVEAQSIQDETGAPTSIPIQVTRLNTPPDRLKIEAEEMLFTAPAENLADRTITIDTTIANVNLRTAHDQQYPEPSDGDVITCTIAATAIVSSSYAGLPAFDVGTWPAGVTINIINLGGIHAAGGDAGAAGHAANGTANPGRPGGDALRTTVAINLTNTTGRIWGGGGGGGGGGANYKDGGGGGGGGAGYNQAGFGAPGGNAANGGTSGNPGISGSFSSAGAGGSGAGVAGNGGAGGDPGAAGAAGVNASPFPFLQVGSPGLAAGGGAAGRSIDGISHVTFIGASGDIRGPTIN